MPSDLITAFNEYFELIHADTDALRMQVYQLRYQVYVLETGFESEADCLRGHDESGKPIHWEMDEFDNRSDHYLLRHRRTGVYAATARLILPMSMMRRRTAPWPWSLTTTAVSPTFRSFRVNTSSISPSFSMRSM